MYVKTFIFATAAINFHSALAHIDCTIHIWERQPDGHEKCVHQILPDAFWYKNYHIIGSPTSFGNRAHEWRDCKVYPTRDCTTLVWTGDQPGRPCPPAGYAIEPVPKQ